MLLNNGFRNRQAQPRPALFLCGKERIEDFGENGGGYARSVVSYRDMRFASAPLDAYVQDAVLRQGIDRVSDKIGEHLEDIAGVDFGRDIGLEPFAKIDSLGRDLLLVHTQSGFGQGGDRD
jgi:hypothetical protein